MTSEGLQNWECITCNVSIFLRLELSILDPLLAGRPRPLPGAHGQHEGVRQRRDAGQARGAALLRAEEGQEGGGGLRDHRPGGEE